MTILLSCRELSKSYNTRPLFDKLSFGIDDGERTGLIGPNGAGKSTLLKILAGIESCDAGELSARRGLNVCYLAQADVFSTAAGAANVRATLIDALKKSGLEEWEIDLRVDIEIARSGCSPEKPLSSLSGGERKRLAILRETIKAPDLLLLDEPTNHLDLEGILWLERLLADVSFSFITVTHDRRFLESVCTRIIELNPRYPGGHFSSPGNYSRFIENREALFDALNSREESQRNIVRREIEWLRKGPRARTTKQKARIERAGVLIEDLAELSHRNAQARTAGIRFVGSERKSRRVVETIGISKSLGGRALFGQLDIFLGPGDKLGLLGANGSGKSTLMKILAGFMEPDAGEIKRAERLKVAVFDQHREQLDLSMTLRKALCDQGEFVEYLGRKIHINHWAVRFLFTVSQLDMPLSKLSGGEQARVLIARLMLQPADLLLIDEPTNDLDIGTLKVLESSLLEFPGALVLVTHDRYLLDRVSDRLLSLDGAGGAAFYEDLAQWESARAQLTEAQALAAPSAPRPAKADEVAGAQSHAAPRPTKKLSWSEEKELKSIEGKIQTAEEKRDRAVAALSDPEIASDVDKLIERQSVVDECTRAVEELYRRWEELDAKKNASPPA